MDILGLGVLLTGESGLGKSELGLELISRGHGLVADDAVDLYRISQNTLEGRCPELLMNLLEVRGIGLLDIKAIFGETAVRRKMRLKLIVHLVRKETLEREFERLPYEPLHETCWACRCSRWSSRWTPAATWRCWWRRRCATPSCSCAASTPTRNSSPPSGGDGCPAAGCLTALRCSHSGFTQLAYRASAWSCSWKPCCWAMARWRCFDLGVEELLHPAAGQAHQVVVVRPSLSSKTALPDSKWLRSRMPACSNCISTR
jgi:hypothetical protein